MTTPQKERQVFKIPEETATQFGPISSDFRLGWLALLSIIFLVLIFLTALLHSLQMLIATGVYLLLALLLYSTMAFQLLEGGNTTFFTLVCRRVLRRRDVRRGYTRQTLAMPSINDRRRDKVSGELDRLPAFRLFGRLRFYPYMPPGQTDQPLGVVRDSDYLTRSATMWTATSSILSADDESTSDMLEGFARLLDLLAGHRNPVDRFVWRQQTLMGEPQHADRMREAVKQAANLPSRPGPNQDVVTRRLIEMGESSSTTRTTMTVTVQDKLTAKRAKQLGGADPVLLEAITTFYNYTMGVGESAKRSPFGIREASFLSYSELVIENRLAMDPVLMQPFFENWIANSNGDWQLDEAVAWPKFVDSQADYCRVGETFHKGFYVGDINTKGITPADIWGLLRVSVPKTVAVIYQVVPHARAVATAEWQTTGSRNTESDRVNSKRRVTENQRAHTERVEEIERELARSGHEIARCRIYVDVHGATFDEVSSNAQQVQAAVLSTELLLEPLTARHEKAVLATMPCGRGLAALGIRLPGDR